MFLIRQQLLIKSQREIISKQIEEKSILLGMKQNNYDGAKKLFEENLSKSVSLLDKVADNYYLADICLHCNETEEALEHLRFVIENGGDTFYVSEAKEILCQITGTI